MKPTKLLAFFGLFLSALTANATNFSFTGAFQYDNDVQLFTFTVDSVSSVSLRSWSYAGGTNAAGQSIAQGGFDPILALFDSTGTRIGQQDDGGCALVAADSVTSACFDTFFTTTLQAGTYTASVQQYDNFANTTLAAGFIRDGAQNQNFANGFVDFTGNQRTASWAFDVLNVNQAAVIDLPEPASISLALAAVAGMAFVKRRKVGQQVNATC